METSPNLQINGIERLNALMTWWGVPASLDGGAAERQSKRFQQFLSDLQKTYSDGYSTEMSMLFEGNEHIAGAFQELLRSRRPRDVLAAESELLAALFERASLRAKRWVELTQKFQECCAAMAHDAATELREQAEEPAASVEARSAMEGESAKPPRRQAAAK